MFRVSWQLHILTICGAAITCDAVFSWKVGYFLTLNIDFYVVK